MNPSEAEKIIDSFKFINEENIIFIDSNDSDVWVHAIEKILKDINLRKIPEIIYLLSPSEIMPHHISRLYSQLKNLTSKSINSENLVISHHLEQAPDRLSRVILSDKKNYLGINNLNLHK